VPCPCSKIAFPCCGEANQAWAVKVVISIVFCGTLRDCLTPLTSAVLPGSSVQLPSRNSKSEGPVDQKFVQTGQVGGVCVTVVEGKAAKMSKPFSPLKEDPERVDLSIRHCDG